MSWSLPSRKMIPVSTRGTVLIHADFLLTGIVMTFLGPMLPTLSSRWALTDEQAGYLGFAQFFSSMFGMLSSGALVIRLGYRVTFIIGLLLMAIGMVLLAGGPWRLGIAAVCILGVGHGITTPAGNLRTAEENPQQSAAALNVINAVWGLGAMSSPFLLGMAQRAHHTTLFLYGTAAALLILLLVLAFVRFVPDVRAHDKSSSVRGQRAWNHRLLPLISVLFFVYVGTETSFSIWLASYAQRLGVGRSLWAMTPSAFWCALVAGRMLAPLILKFHRETIVAKIGLILGLVGGVAIVAARGIGLLIPGAVLAGLGLAAIFPVSVSLFPRWFGESTTTASSPVFACGNTGGAVLPWLVGVLSTRTGSLRLALTVPVVGMAAMLAFYITDTTRCDHVSSAVGDLGS